MEIRKILVPLDASIYTDGATETAIRIAKAHGASVTGVAVLDSPEIRSSIIPAVGPYYPMMVDAVQEKIEHADQILRDTLIRFSNTCEKAGIEHEETEYEGIPAQKLLESSIFHDLIVLGLETSFHFETRGGRGDTLDKLIDHTATPVLAVPPTGAPIPSKVIIAFDGSFGASRAMRDFIPFAASFDPEITLVSAELPAKKSDFLLSSAVSLLESHGFSKVNWNASEMTAEETFTPAFTADADLIVAGIHSRRPIRDMFTGSFTATLIRDHQKPLFLSH
ncbi:MAG: universal stress protein [Verrucomicrobiales bacterium]|nr:universal stress protein [Verrucomicrobiales bacterium]